MADLNRPAFGAYSSTDAASRAAEFDAGLRAHMMRVYNYMMIGLAITGFVSYGLFVAIKGNPELGMTLYGSPLKWVVMLAPLGVVFFLSMRIHTMSAATAQFWFWFYAGIMGVSLGSIFLVYTGESIVRVFLITSVTFGAMSLYGYTTKRDLSKIGSFLVMGLFGIIIASLVNLFMQSSALQFAISVIGVIVFTGLTAVDTQQIKETYASMDDDETSSRKAIIGALQLYLSFVNLFIMLLSLLGDRE